MTGKFIVFVFYSKIIFTDRENENEAGKQKIEIESVHIHPNYDTPDRANDIALVKLKEPAIFGDHVSPACLPVPGDFGDDSSFPAGMNCILTGIKKEKSLLYG